MLTEKKAATISKIYFDEGGYGSLQNTFKEAKADDPSISYQDVADWFQQNTQRKTQLKGYNSYIPKRAGDEYQIDLFFINDLENQKKKDNIGLMMIDAFSKFMTVVPVESKKKADVLAAIMEAVAGGMKGKWPKILYTDEEGGVYNDEIIDFLEKERGTRLVATRNHAGVAERAIRTFKNMLYKRIEASTKENPQWTDFISQVVVTYNYKLKHSATEMTPNEARQPDNSLNAKVNMELKAKHTRKYPDIKVGNHVRVYFKKKKGEKERVSYWSETKHKVTSISQFMGQSYYHLEDIKRPYLRNEILKV